MTRPAVQIGVCSKRDRQEALELVLRSIPGEHQAVVIDGLSQTRGEPLGPFDALMVATRGGRVAAAVWAQPQPGKTAALWLPETQTPLAETELTRLLEAALAVADARGVAMAQVLLEREAPTTVDRLTRVGFERIAKLRYLEWPAGQQTGAAGAPPPPPAPEPSGGLIFEPRAFDRPARLKRLVQATYVDTLDCPKLEGLRNIDDALAGYRRIGRYDPELWSVLLSGGDEVGVLLLAEHAETRQLELVYMGLVPPARGRGFGHLAIRETQRVASARRVRRVVLAVDADNAPAQRVYEGAGFREWARRVVYVRRRPVGS